MSQTYIAGAVSLIAALLPLFGFEVVDSANLSQNILNIVSLVAAIWVLYRRVSAGDINAIGIKKK